MSRTRPTSLPHGHAGAGRQVERIRQVGEHRRRTLDVAPGVEEACRRRSRWRWRRAGRGSRPQGGEEAGIRFGHDRGFLRRRPASIGLPRGGARRRPIDWPHGRTDPSEPVSRRAAWCSASRRDGRRRRPSHGGSAWPSAPSAPPAAPAAPAGTGRHEARRHEARRHQADRRDRRAAGRHHAEARRRRHARRASRRRAGTAASTAAKIVIGRDEIERYGDSTLRRRAQAPARRHHPGPAGPRPRDPRAGLGGGLHADPARRRAGTAGLLARFRCRPSRSERIEILRAPTAETGARAIAGTINILRAAATRSASTTSRSAPASRRARCSRASRGRATSPAARLSSTGR